ncbi:MAG TPA: hypothetical protein VHL58_00310 [Thermoanaerobaculia bacterium]|nr:hypothetical protein [Thermoanaerobaculia bacterium]
MNWFSLAFVGWVILIIALAIGAHQLGAPTMWVGIGSLALIGIGMIFSVRSAKPPV